MSTCNATALANPSLQYMANILVVNALHFTVPRRITEINKRESHKINFVSVNG